MSRFTLSTASLLAIFATAIPASAAWLAENGMRVEGGPEAIIVHVTPGNGSAQIICAAADYAATRLGAEPAQAVTITQPASGKIDGSGGEKVGFRVSSNADAEPEHGLLLRASQMGTTVKIAHARSMCDGIRN